MASTFKITTTEEAKHVGLSSDSETSVEAVVDRIASLADEVLFHIDGVVNNNTARLDEVCECIQRARVCAFLT